MTAQHGDPPETLAEALDVCPVSCIHTVESRPQLEALEHALTLCEREDVATLADR